MNDFINGFIFTNNISIDSYNLLKYHNQEEVALHCSQVANEAVKIAAKFALNTKEAEVSGLLHDIGKIVHEADMVKIAHKLNINVLEEEESYPDLLHTKLSSIIAHQIFNIRSNSILSAIECHSTLKSNPSALDMILFIADKLSWESEYNQHFKADVIGGLDKSLEHGAFAYINYLNSNTGILKVTHPWLRDAYNYLKSICLD